MTAKRISYGENARASLWRGVAQIVRAVGTTLGPKGRSVALERTLSAALVTRDGVTVAREIKLPNRFEEMGARIVREASDRTSDEAGDGTTTAMVLSGAILENLRAVLIDPALSVVAIQRGLDKAAQGIASLILEQARPVRTTEDVARVGTLAASGDATIGNAIAEIMDAVGKDGVILVEEAKGMADEVVVLEGTRIDRGYASSGFVDEDLKCILEDVAVILVDGLVTTLLPIADLLGEIAGQGRSVLLIAHDVRGDALSTLVVNHQKANLRCCGVKAPSFGDRRAAILQDLAALTGATVISVAAGTTLETMTLAEVGGCKKALVERAHTTIIEGAGSREDVDRRVDTLRNQRDSTDFPYDRDRLQERIGALVGGVGILRVGDITETAMKERKARVEDALGATRAAVEEGVVPGGGVALLKAALRYAEHLHEDSGDRDEELGVRAVVEACGRPLALIARNADRDPGEIRRAVLATPAGWTWDANTGLVAEMAASGISDPAKVVRRALRNAASATGILATCEAAIVLMGDADPADPSKGLHL